MSTTSRHLIERHTPKGSAELALVDRKVSTSFDWFSHVPHVILIGLVIALLAAAQLPGLVGAGVVVLVVIAVFLAAATGARETTSDTTVHAFPAAFVKDAEIGVLRDNMDKDETLTVMRGLEELSKVNGDMDDKIDNAHRIMSRYVASTLATSPNAAAAMSSIVASTLGELEGDDSAKDASDKTVKAADKGSDKADERAPKTPARASGPLKAESILKDLPN